ncbi:hypothetical protein [Streptomyces sp. NPDC057382]|uniref:hypothetical protein n=1 Tax=unclassified Streptomyces TaxID=2593676 RepID=UPI003625186D
MLDPGLCSFDTRVDKTHQRLTDVEEAPEWRRAPLPVETAVRSRPRLPALAGGVHRRVSGGAWRHPGSPVPPSAPVLLP